MNMYNQIFMQGLHKFAVKQEIADIRNRDRCVSRWVAAFYEENDRIPTDAECDEEVATLEQELKELGGE